MSPVSFTCPNCRHELAPSVSICTACGTYIASGEIPAATATVTVSSASSVSDKRAGANQAAWASLLSAPQGADEIGRLGPYRVLGQLGAGGMGIVFKAEDIHLKRLVALKVMLPEYAANPIAKARFLREARAAAKVEHDHIVPIFQVGEDHHTAYLAMPLLKGQSLSDLLKTNPRALTLFDVVRLGREIAEGLAAAHDAGLIHRDIKPANIWLEGSRQRVRILDFGLARVEADDGTDDATLTKEGNIVGTPSYMSPEQARTLPLDGRSDLFSLGVVLYQMATGRLPFEAESRMGTLMAIATENPVPPIAVNPQMPRALNDLILSMLNKRREDRPATAHEVARRLADIEVALTAVPLTSVPLASPADIFADIDSTEIQPSAVRHRPAAPRKRFPAAIVLAAIGLIVLIGGTLFIVAMVRGGKGVLVIESDDPAAEVVVRKDGKIIRERTKEREIELPSGEYTIESMDGKLVSPGRVTLAKNGRILVQLLAPPASRVLDPSQSEKLAAQRRAEAEAAFPALEAKFKERGIKFDSVASNVNAFKAKFGGTPAAVKAAEMLMKLPSPLDPLRKIPAECIEDWRAMGREIPPELVLVLGEHHRRHWGDVTCICESPDGKTIAIGDATGVIHLQETSSLKTAAILSAHVGSVVSLAFTGDGRYLISGGNDYMARIWDMTSKKQTQEFKGPTSHSYCLAVSRDSEWLVTGRDALGMACFHIPGKEKPPDFANYNVVVAKVAISADGKRVVSAGQDGTVRLWEFSTGKELKQFKDQGFVMSPDGKRVLSWHGESAAIHYWDTETGTELWYLASASGNRCGAISPDGKTAVTGGNDGAIYVWNLETGKLTRRVGGDMLVVHRLYFVDDSQVVSVSSDKTNRVWNIDDGKELRRLETNEPILDYLPKSRRSVQWARNAARHWDVQTGKEVEPLTGQMGYVRSLAFSSDCRFLLTGNADATVRRWKIDPPEETQQYPGHGSAVNAVTFGWDGNRVFSAGEDGRFHLFDVDPPRVAKGFTHTAQPSAIYSIAVSPDQRRVIAGGAQGFLMLWDVDAPTQPRQLAHAGGHISAVAFSPDGRLAVSCGEDSTVKLWETDTGREVRRFTANIGRIPAVAFTPDGLNLVVGGHDAKISIVAVSGGRNVRSWEAHSGQGGGVYSIAMSPDGGRFATHSPDGRISVWSIDGKELQSFKMLGPVQQLAFAADGRHLATANGNGTVYVLRLPVAKQ